MSLMYFNKINSIIERLKNNKTYHIINNKDGSLLGLTLSIIIISVVTASATSWYLSTKKNLNESTDKLIAMTLAYNEWNKIVKGNFSEQEDFANETITKDAGEGYQIQTTYSKKGVYQNGKCDTNKTLSGTDIACMETTIDVKDKTTGESLYKLNQTRLSRQGDAVQNDSYKDNHRLSLKYEQATDDSGVFLKNNDGSPKMTLSGYVDTTKLTLNSGVRAYIEKNSSGSPVGVIEKNGRKYHFAVRKKR